MNITSRKRQLSTNFSPEQIALLEAANIPTTLKEAGIHIDFLSGCESALENLLPRAKDNASRDLQTALANFSQKCNAVLQ